MTYPTSSSASDVWSLRDVYKAEAGDDWPTIATSYTFIFAGADEGNASDYSITSPTGNERIALPNGASDLCFFVADWTYQPADANHAGGWDATIDRQNNNADTNWGFAVFDNLTYNQTTSRQETTVSLTGVTVGSLLVYVGFGNNDGISIPAPSGYTTVLDHGTATGGTACRTHISYKIADATSESFSVNTATAALLEYTVSGSTSLIASNTGSQTSADPLVATAPTT